MHAGAGMAVRVEVEPEWLADGGANVVGERHLRPRGDVLAEHAEALVRVDAAAAGRRDRHGAVEREPGGVREQVPHGRARRAGRLVEIDDTLLGGDERRESG